MTTQSKYDFPWRNSDEVQLAQTDLYANAYNAAVNHGSDRAAKKMRHLVESINRYERIEGRARLQFLVDQGVIDGFNPCHPTDCHMRPGGLFHAKGCENDPNSEVSRARRKAAKDTLPERLVYAASPSLVGAASSLRGDDQ